ncbi:iron-containing alcohol dehydrogenase [Micromonospora sp. C51]|uniref:3-dehydroquinate synthase family protein n=1 Tax=Micromonospora sp. C51 TaxID=2824879 RepID=UPI001B392D8C|nr:iron-containing alcohol dehydrogenase [Micromonospora sp. C51]MBQ1053068.1 iron-containing alcohol dehydrogenase [Micromonospora sp. C51]
MRERKIPLDGSPVSYLYGVDCAAQLAEAFSTHLGAMDSLLLVVDSRVTAHAEPIGRALADLAAVTTFTVEASEGHKTFSLVERILERAVAMGATRRTVVVGMGGGMVGNVAGLAAALLMRGIRLVHLPTTPVAAFDSVLSVKQAVNLRGGKNLCGTYHAPSLIGCDLRWLSTVPHDEMLTGLAEMVKNMLAVLPQQRLTLERALHRLPEEPMQSLLSLLELGLSAKIPYLDEDPREKRAALIFEYGHTMGHAIEFVSAGVVNHGAAVAWGMLVAAEVSRELGHLSDCEVDDHYRTVSLLRLPPATAGPGRLAHDQLRSVLARDNKRGYLRCRPGEVPMVLLKALGTPVTDGNGQPLTAVPIELILSALDRVVARDEAAEVDHARLDRAVSR